MKADACNAYFAAATGRDGNAPADTLTAAISIAHNMAYQAGAHLRAAGCVLSGAAGKHMRVTPYLPYLNFAPGAWVLPLKFAGGGNAGGAKVMFDSEGNAWSGDNFLVGWQGHDALWNGNMRSSLRTDTAFPNDHGLYGRRPPRSRLRHGDRRERPRLGGQHQWPDDFAVRQQRQAAVAAGGLQLRGQLRTMQGIIVTPNGDVWALDFGDDNVVYMPKGDPSKANSFASQQMVSRTRIVRASSTDRSIWRSTSRIGSGSPTRSATP